MPDPARLLVSTITTGLLLAGCGSGPIQTGAAAFVGATRIPLSEVQGRYRSVLDKLRERKQEWQRTGQMDDLGRSVASLMVQQELLRQAARDEGIRVDNQQITAVIDQRGGPRAASAHTLLTPRTHREAVRSELIAVELGRKYVDRLAVTVDWTLAETRGAAESKARQMARSGQKAAAVLEADRKAGLPVVSGKRLHAADSPQLAAVTPLFGARVGTAVAFESRPQSGQWLVARIRERDTSALTLTPIAGRLEDETLGSIGMRLLGLRSGAVRVNPRYGVWDPVALSTAPGEGETLGFWFAGSEPVES